MKKLFLPVVLCFVCTTAAAQEFGKGDRLLDFSVGVGVIPGKEKSLMSFDQHFGMEWGIGQIRDQVTVGLGFTVNNTFAPGADGTISGTYDYYYNQYINSAVIDYNKWNQVHREGSGTAETKVRREDINAQITVSFHYSPVSRLDIYTKFGVGVGVMNYLYGKTRNEKGFTAKTVDKTVGTGSHYIYSFNDLDHARWDKMKSKVVPAVSAFVGATYYLSDRWGVEAQVGLLSANIKDEDKGYPNSYSFFSVGASYKF